MEWDSTLLVAHPFYARLKNPIVVGTWADGAFQASFIPEQLQDEALQIPFYDPAGCHSITQLGIYNQDDYQMLPTRILIQMPFVDEILTDHLPHGVLEEISKAPNGQEMYLIWHDRIEVMESNEFKAQPELNVMFHPWVFRWATQHDFESDQGLEYQVRLGAFSEWLGNAVEEVNKPDLPPLLNGIPLGRLDSRYVGIHHRAFSPHNSQLRMSPLGAPLHAFFSVCLHEGRAIVCFHVVPGSSEIQNKIAKATLSANNLQELVSKLVEDQEIECFKLRILSLMYPLTQIFK